MWVYIFVKPENFSKDKKEIEQYRLKRKYSLFGLASFISLFFIKIILASGLFLTAPSTPVKAISVSWNFDNPSEYIYNSSKIQIVDGVVVFKPSNLGTESPSEPSVDLELKEAGQAIEPTAEPTVEPTPEPTAEPTAEPTVVPTPEPTAEPTAEPTVVPTPEPTAEPTVVPTPEPTAEPTVVPTPEPTAEPTSWLNDLFKIPVCYASVNSCVEQIQPVSSLKVVDLERWTGFVEVAEKNGGEIYYQLSDNEGADWYYYDQAWKKVESDNQYNTAAEINEKITDFPITNQQLLFRAFLTSDCQSEIKLIDLTINYDQKQIEESIDSAPLNTFSATEAITTDLINIATNQDNFKASVTNKGTAKDLAESEPLNATWTVYQGGDNLEIWVRYDAGASTKVDSYEITPTTDSLRTPKKWLFQGSNSADDGYQTLDEQSNVTNWAGESSKFFELAQSATYQYYRILIQASNHDSRVALARIRIFAYYERMYTVRSNQNDVKITNASGNEIVSTAKGFYVNHKDVFGTDNQIAYLEIKDNVDLSSWTVGSDSSNNISVIHINGNDRSSIEKIRLIVKKNAGDDYVRVCPGATDIRDVRSGCENEIILTTDGSESGGYKLVEKDDRDNWHVENNDVNNFSTGIQSGVISPENGLVSLWKFDENTGCVANDSFGSNHGALGQTCPGTAPVWTSGIFNSALSFTANNQRVVVPDNGNLDLTNKGSLAAWVNISSYSNYAGIIHKGQLSNFSDSAYFMQMGGTAIAGSNSKKVLCGGHDGITDRYHISNQELGLNTWYHLVCTWDESGQKMYINGNLNASTTTAVVNRITTGSLQIGSQVLTNYFFRGKIDEPAIYNYALSASQVATLYNNPVTASIEVINPNGGESLNVGTSTTITWNSLNTSGNVKIEYSKDNFVSDIQTIVASTTDNGSYDWLIPNDPSTTVKIRISDVNTPTVNDTSNATFTIIYPASITLTYPNGGESVFANSFASIRWTSVNTSGNVKIEYSKDNFVSDIQTIVASTTDNGSYDWLIPNDPSTTVKIRISDVANPSVKDESNANFKIAQSNSNPVGFWKLDENTGCTAVDSFGENDGILSPSCPTDSPAWVTGKVNSSLDFDGANDFVTINNSASLNPSSAITLSAWIKWDINPTTGNQWATIINKNDDNQYRLQHNQTNTAFEFALRTSVTANKWINSNTIPQQGVWYYVVGTYDGQTMKLYVNGALEKSTTCYGYIYGSSNPLNISKRRTNDRYFNGKIDEVGIWNRALSASEIAQMYLEGNNNRPEITINSVSQQNDDGYVNINYTLADAESNYVALDTFSYSVTSATDESITMTPVVTDDLHSGINSLTTSTAGISHTFVWNAKADLGDTFNENVWVKLQPNDGITAGEIVTSNAFAVDVKNPQISNLEVAQEADSNIVSFSYDLADDNSPALVEASFSEDAGNTWASLTENVSGDIGDNVETGVAKTIIWDAGLGFPEKDLSNLKFRLQAKDSFQNQSAFIESGEMALDTKMPFGMADFIGVSSTPNAAIWAWNPVISESNFVGYELWYGTNSDDVANKSASAKKWDNTNDNGLTVMGTASTTITGLIENTKYFAKIWAKDLFGNTATLPTAELTTPIAPDTTAPFKPILDQPISPRTDKELLISGTAEAGSNLDLYINGKKVEPLFATVSSAGSFSGKITLDLGMYELYATSTDSEGNVSVKSDSRFVEITAAKTEEVTIITNAINEDSQAEEETEEEEIIVIPTAVSTKKEIVEEILEARENPILAAPEILTINTNQIGQTIQFSGTGVPNSEIILFIHSNQAVTYKVKVDENGNWQLAHSQNDLELEEGEHEVYGITMDAGSNIKSQPSQVTNFTLKKNYLAQLLSYFDLPTTILTIAITFLGFLTLLVYKKRSLV